MQQKQVPEFVHSIRTYPDLVCVFGQKALLDKVLLLESLSPQLLSYDTTFQLGDFYISVLSFRHTLFKEAPTIPVAFLLHERKFEEHHKEMLNICIKLVRSLRTASYPIVTDEERAIVNAISEILPQAVQLWCWNHIFRDATRWLRSHGAPSQNISVYLDNIRTLFHLQREDSYTKTLAELKRKWSAPFFDYYTRNIHTDIHTHAIARWSIETYKVYNPYSGVTNNQAEGLNFVLKQLQDWCESPPDCMLLSLYYLQSFYMKEIVRGQHGLGNYHVHDQYCGLVCTQPVQDQTAYSPEDIVARIKGNLQQKQVDKKENIDTTLPNVLPETFLSQRARAQQLITDKKISFDSSLHTFTILGSGDKPHAVRLFPNETCTCPSTTQCYHILAAKMSIGFDDDSKTPKKKINLTQLRRNARSRREKKSGRKIPRPGDIDVLPAPDADPDDGHKSDNDYDAELTQPPLNLGT